MHLGEKKGKGLVCRAHQPLTRKWRHNSSYQVGPDFFFPTSSSFPPPPPQPAAAPSYLALSLLLICSIPFT
jgi:hypothetical protein